MYSTDQCYLSSGKLSNLFYAFLIAFSIFYSDSTSAVEFYWDSAVPYTLDNGELNTSTSYIGSITTGTFIQNGGTHRPSSLILGKERDSSGFYHLNDGLLQSFYSYIGYLYGSGEFNQNGGTHSAQFNSRINRGSSYNLNDGIFNVGLDFAINGTMNVSGGEFSAGRINNNGSLNINEGANNVQTFTGTTYNNGDINLVDGKSIVFESDVFGAGNLFGGTKLFHNSFQPGAEVLPPPDRIDPLRYFLADGAILSGETIFEDTATLSMYLLDDGQSDWLSIDGSAQLDGTLNLLIGQEDYTPQVGDSWEILVGDGIYGTFDSIISNAPSEWDWVVDYLDDRVIVTAVEAAVVPIPAAFWLFGTGLLGLFGLSQRSKTK